MLEQDGFRAVPAGDGPSGFYRAITMKPGMVLVDLRLPGRSGAGICKRLRASQVKTPAARTAPARLSQPRGWLQVQRGIRNRHGRLRHGMNAAPQGHSPAGVHGSGDAVPGSRRAVLPSLCSMNEPA